MKIRILGSGGGEGFPATFCTCEHCEEARRVGGKSLRSLHQTLINDDLVIDFPVDTDAHCRRYGVNLGKIQNFLITHPHSDHYAPISLVCRGSLFAHNLKYEKTFFYGSEGLERIFDSAVAPYGIDATIRSNIGFVTMNDRQTEKVGAYTVTALKAEHAPHLNSLNYVISDGKVNVLYLIDSGYPTKANLDYLNVQNYVFDCVVMDATMGYAPVGEYVYHMGFEENKILKTELISRGLATIDTEFVATHFTHNKAETHDKIEAIYNGTDFIIAYDGIEIDVG